MPRPDADTRYLHYRFASCRAAVAACHPGTAQWRHRFWLRESITVTGELGFILIAGFAVWHLTQPLPPLAQAGLDSLGLVLLSRQLRSAIRQISAETRSFHDGVAHYAAHRAYVDAQILSRTVHQLATWSITESQLVAAGLLPEPNSPSILRDKGP